MVGRITKKENNTNTNNPISADFNRCSSSCANSSVFSLSNRVSSNCKDAVASLVNGTFILSVSQNVNHPINRKMNRVKICDIMSFGVGS